ncbi:MAG: mycofactocin-associated electron transfer flavoprotein beta subunit, partial [Microthrixaceae bacterium]
VDPSTSGSAVTSLTGGTVGGSVGGAAAGGAAAGGGAPSDGALIAVCVKWATLHAEVDPIRGTVQTFNHDAGFSEADLAAVETALRLAEAWTTAGTATSVIAVCVGPETADGALRGLMACGVSRSVRIDYRSDAGPVQQLTSAAVAKLLANEIVASGARMVICGDVSADRGSGSVPAFLAHRLGAAQALGLIEVRAAAPEGAVSSTGAATSTGAVSSGKAASSGGAGSPESATVVGRVNGVRRLDGARREVLHVTTPAVISVEGAVADLRRASLPASIAARAAVVEVRTPTGGEEVETALLGPWRPRARVVAAPDAPDALSRIVTLTGATSNRTPARTEHLEPADAARAILDQLTEWGYLGDDPGSAGASGRADGAGSAEG